MNKKQLAILEKAWDAQISCALKEQTLPIIQTKSKIAMQLCDDGFLDEVEITHQMVTFKGYEINHYGIAAYCSHLPDDVDIEEMEMKR
ncbi:hypothetical protein JGI24_000137 [Salmonella enterica]|nr:hypothetical protein [Salmonella enterica subsp. enterica serovar Pomona]EDY3584661.1 hypothetical protein [Salmonella enterica]EBR9558170.1 hypothetical protein [Salmonella enterica subsp. enterica serovar Pomona]EBW2504437.1 hypothetical protein [Salmonella enterica subsp. enterica serovar Pomona]EBZ8417190.1 hypothetical protein [Salmonella enterica subsp. enterica serovar Pomona]